jgi:hypothetical protein
MKKALFLILTAILCAPAFGQVRYQGLHPRPQAPTVFPAHEPIILQTGRPITQADKQQLIVKAKNTFHGAPVGKGGAAPQNFVIGKSLQLASSPSGTASITPDQMVSGNLSAVAWGVALWDPVDGNLEMAIGHQSFMIFDMNVNPNTLYVLTIKVITGTSAPVFTLQSTEKDGQAVSTHPPQTVNGTPYNGPQGAVTEIAYAFDSNGTGTANVVISSGNSGWGFLGAELTASPM